MATATVSELPPTTPDQRGSHPRAATRRAVLQVLTDAATPVGIARIAGQLRLHRNTVRFHLGHLVATGQVERVGTASGALGRPAALYRAVPTMDPDGPRHYRLLAQVLVTALGRAPQARSRAVAAGRQWGSRLVPPPVAGRRSARRSVLQLFTTMRDMGFDPDLDPHGSQLQLRHCPFLELATGDPPGLVCQVHLGIVQGALESWDAPITVDRLDPLVTPDRCVAHLRRVPGPS